MDDFYDRHNFIAKIVCRLRGHRGSRTQLYDENDTYLFYWLGCIRCQKRRYVFKVRKDEPSNGRLVSLHNLYNIGYTGKPPF